MSGLTVEIVPDSELGGFTARVPDIPAYGEGDTEEQALADLREALTAYIEAFGIDDANGPREFSQFSAPLGRGPGRSSVPKLPRLTGAQMVRFLQSQGFAIVRIRGSHHVMQRGTLHNVCPRAWRSNIAYRDIARHPARHRYEPGRI